MELRIINPQNDGFIKEIQWNNEELKAEVATKMEEYRGLVFTEDTIKDAKKDRASLNKLKMAFEDERKRIKKLCMDPYNRFEMQVKEVIALIDESIRFIDGQIKEIEENERTQKRKDIEELFLSIGFQTFVTLDAIWEDKWLNKTVSLSKIEEQMKERMFRIGEDIGTINQLQEFSFEALEIYKKTMDLSCAIQEGRRLSDIQKRKAEYEEAERQRLKVQAEELERREVEEKADDNKQAIDHHRKEPVSELIQESAQEELHLDFRVWGTREQLLALRDYMTANNLKFGKVE